MGVRERDHRFVRQRDDRGTIVVEAAFVTPVFFVLIFAILEFGLAFADRLAVQDMSLNGARVASGAGDEALADFFVLRSADDGVFTSGDLDTIVVYRASGPSDTVPAACKTASQPGDCNHYTKADLALPDTKFGCGATAVDTAWCPTSRKTAVQGINGPPDYVGVFVQSTHPMITKLFGDTYTFTSDTVIRLEPRSLN